MIRRNLTAAYLRLEAWGWSLATWARRKADALLPAFAIIVMLGGLMAANYAVSHTVVVAGR